jgi:hypothetical protein
MGSVALKVLLTPILIAAASLSGRRWGPAISGWLVGLPLTSGPIALFLAIGQGTAFAAAAAAGTLAGTLSQAAFCLAYSWLALGCNWRWVAAVLGGCFAFLATTAVLTLVPVPLVVTYPLVIGALLASLRLLPKRSQDGAAARDVHTAIPSWDLPARMVVATALVLLLTGIASTLGPRLTGLIAPFPLYATILAVFAHRQLGADAAVNVLRGLLIGLFGFATFFLLVASLIQRYGTGPAFVGAIIATLVLQGTTLLFVQAAGPATHEPSSG